MPAPPTQTTVEQTHAEHPSLTPVAPGHYAGADQAVINVRQDLKKQFPELSFRVRLQTRRGGATVLTLAWTEWPDVAITPATIDAHVRLRWVHRRDRSEPMEERERRERFQSVFGSVERLQLEPVPPTPEQWVRHERRLLRATMNDHGSRELLTVPDAPRPTRSRL